MVILAPSCNLDVYINYCYNQLTHTLLEVCVCACVCMCAYVCSFYISFFFFFFSAMAFTSTACFSLSLSLPLFCVRWEQFTTGCVCVCAHVHMCVHAGVHMRVCSHMEPILGPDDHSATTRPLHATLASYTHRHTHTHIRNVLGAPFWQRLCN